MATASPHRRRSWVLLLAALLAVGSAVPPGVPAGAAPRANQQTPRPGDEGGTPLLRDVLEAAGRGYVTAKGKLERSRKRQVQLTLELRLVEDRLAGLRTEVGAVAGQAYRNGRLGAASVLLDSASPDAFVRRAAALESLAAVDDAKLRELHREEAAAAAAKRAIDLEVAEQRKQLTVMATRRAEAERALVAVGGAVTGGFVAARSPVAAPARRAPDGSWPAESCTMDDPTTSGCLTPRTLHALRQAKAAGFTRYVACYRTGDMYEHPKGRACDFSPQWSGFGGAATGEPRLYGNNLAAFFVRNADRLGVLYVIWYRQVWFPATGWRSYSAAYGDPSSDHTNHVHLSML